jgi:hypothetical protein
MVRNSAEQCLRGTTGLPVLTGRNEGEEKPKVEYGAARVVSVRGFNLAGSGFVVEGP